MRLLVAGLLLAYGQVALAGQHTIPLLVPSSDLERPPGVLRIINHDAESGSVEISAIDDAGVRSGPVTLTLDAGTAVELDAVDLEMGNPAKGLSAGLGGGMGDRRLEIDSDLDIEPLAYVRTADGFVASMHDLVREENMRYAVPVFNTGGNVSELSRLRLINPGGGAAGVTITATDDGGAASSGAGVSLTLPAGGARTLTAGQLEAGGSGLSGGLGTGTGKWRLVVTADRPILVMNLLANTSGRLGNLSTSGMRDNAPGSHAAFGSRFSGMMLAYTVDGETATLEVLEEGRFTETAEVGGVSSTYAGGYGYERTGLNAGRLTLTYDDGDECLDNVYFTSTTAGWFTSSCTGVATESGSWNAIESSVAPPSFAAATIADQAYTVGTAIGALTLPEASGGKGTLSYSLSPSIPGLAFSAATRQLTGTPTAAGTHAMTYGVTDSDGDSDTLSFSITVEDSDGGTPGTNEGDCHVGLFVSPGGSCTYPGTSDAFSVDQDGRASFLVISSTLAINVNNVTFMGRFYDFRASHQGDGVWRIDRLEGSTTPTTGGETDTSPTFPAMGGPGDQTYALDTAITALTLPAASGGDGTLTYSLSPDVPGLSFDPITRQLTGTPTTEGSFAMTYTITDADGDSDSISFTITVEESDDGGNDKAALMALYNATDGANWSRSDNWGTSAPLDQWHGVTVDTNGRVIRLELPENQLSGPIPAELGDLANLEWLDLGRNALTGSIPPELAKLTNLETLDLAYGENALSGSIPPELGNLTNLTWLRLAGNTLSGSIPQELGQLGNLQRLDLDHNELSGSVPSWLGNLTNLHALDLAGNQLSGSIPPELGKLTNLQSWLLLFNNQLSGPIPPELGDLAKLEELILGGNQLSGPIPAELGDLANLERLWLDGNELSGPIPAELGDLANLQWLLLSGNQLSGCIPDGLRDVPTSDLSELGLTFCGDGTMGGETSYGVGDAIDTLPTGSWFPDVTSGGSFSLSGGNAVVRLNNGGYIEEGDYRYTCESAGGCQITNGTVDSGTIVETSTATMPEDTQPSFASGSGPGNQTYTVGTAIDTLTLPAASGGDGTLTYSLSPSVPGLTFNAATRQLTGTPTAAGTHAMTYTVTDGDGDTLDFTITIEAMGDSEPSFGTTTIADQAYTAGTAIDALTLPEASGGDATLSYSLSPNVPGLAFDAATRQLTGTPTAAGTHAMTYTVTDADGDSDTLSFGITVEESDGGTPGANEGDCQVGQLVSPGGSCTYPGTSDAFSVDQDGRASFLVISSVRAINVNSLTFMGQFYDFRASHQGDGVWRIDRLEGSTTPTTGGGTGTSPTFPAMGGPGDQTYALDTAITALTLPAATGGDGTLSYSLSPSVPGLTFNATTRQLTGTPTAAGAHAMTYTVTDTDGDSDTLSFTITVVEMHDSEPSFGTSMIADQAYTVDTVISALTLPEANGGDGALNYSLSPSVPGLSFDAATRRLTGTPTAAGAHAMTYTVTDTDGDSDTLSFTITVVEMGGEPSNDCQVGQLVSPGGSCTYPGTSDAFTVDQDGGARFLVFSSMTAINVNSASFMGRFYDFRASHQGDGVWRIDRLEGSTMPTTGGGTDTSPTFPVTGGPGDQTYTLNSAIAALTLPAATGGDGTLTYSLSPNVPGLSFDAMTRQLTGTPTAADTHEMTYRVTDEDGDSDSLAFTITVQGGGVSGSPDLVVQSTSVSDNSPEPGALFTYHATVRNQGTGQSAATTLRYYRSTDFTISTTDTELGTDAVSALSPRRYQP